MPVRESIGFLLYVLSWCCILSGMNKRIVSKPLCEIVEKYINSSREAVGKGRFVVLQVGDDKGSTKYIELKKKAGDKYGVKIEHICLDSGISEDQLYKVVEDLNLDLTASGIMLQSPIPGVNLESVANKIFPSKDFDGMSKNAIVLPAVVVSMLHYLEYIFLSQSLIEFEKLLYSKSYFEKRDGLLRDSLIGKRICIVNDSIILGKPMAKYFLSLGLAVDVCNKYTKDIAVFTKNADVLITATGVSNLIKGGIIKPGVMILDAGYPDGDVEVSSIEDKCQFYSPVPGGVGPLTVVSLFENICRLNK